jgi:bisphosphoglycerate-independent phosphoglycerate mutase (AlkP superfamily)
VPLLWYGKGIPQGVSLYDPIQITDISATLVHLLNLQRPGSMTGKPILPLLQPKK